MDNPRLNVVERNRHVLKEGPELTIRRTDHL